MTDRSVVLRVFGKKTEHTDRKTSSASRGFFWDFDTLLYANIPAMNSDYKAVHFSDYYVYRGWVFDGIPLIIKNSIFGSQIMLSKSISWHKMEILK